MCLHNRVDHLSRKSAQLENKDFALCTINKLKLNDDKSQNVMIDTNSTNRTSVKLLGIHPDSRLKWCLLLAY